MFNHPNPVFDGQIMEISGVMAEYWLLPEYNQIS